MPPKRPRAVTAKPTANRSHTAAVKRRQTAAKRAGVAKPKPRAQPKPRAKKIPVLNNPADNDSDDNSGNNQTALLADENKAGDQHNLPDDELTINNKDVQEISAANAEESFSLRAAPEDDNPFKRITIQAEVKVLWHYPPYKANKYRGLSQPIALTKYITEALIIIDICLHR